MILLKMRERRR